MIYNQCCGLDWGGLLFFKYCKNKTFLLEGTWRHEKFIQVKFFTRRSVLPEFSLNGVEYVDDLKITIKNKIPVNLKDYDAYRLILKAKRKSVLERRNLRQIEGCGGNGGIQREQEGKLLYYYFQPVPYIQFLRSHE